MRVIYKYPVMLPTQEPSDDRTIGMHMNPSIVAVGKDPRGQFCIWAEVESDDPIEPYHFTFRGTGHPVPEDSDHIGHVVDGSFVWHLYMKWA